MLISFVAVVLSAKTGNFQIYKFFVSRAFSSITKISNMSTPVSLTSLDPSVIKSANDESSSSDVNDIDVVMPANEVTPTSIRRDQSVENEGLKLWHERRKAWTQPTANARSSAFYLPQELQSIQKMYTIYDSLIYKRRKLARPLPLPAVVSHICHTFGKRSGTCLILNVHLD